MATPSTSAAIAHLYRRAGFGATAKELAAATAAGYSATVTKLVGGLGGPDDAADAVPVPTFTMPIANLTQLRDTNLAAYQAYQKQIAAENPELVTWWLGRMLATTNPLAEKLTFLLHGHLPTAISKVRYAAFMYRQNQLFRTEGWGDFPSFMQQVSADPAMLIWLDAAQDKASNPNENYARELMERFTMGIGTYTQADVRAGAYCFTGWTLNPTTGTFSVNARQHDNTPQTFLGVSGVTTGQQCIQIASTSAASAKFVPAAFWSHLAYPVTTSDPVVADLAEVYGSNRSISNLLTAIFNHPAFLSSNSLNGLVKQPTEYLVGTLRAFGTPASAVQNATTSRRLQGVLADLGQILFDPPSVGGWGQNTYWLSTAAALTRWEFAETLARELDISAISDAPYAARLDAVAEVLSIPSWSTDTAKALQSVADNPVTLTTMALVSPEYVTN